MPCNGDCNQGRECICDLTIKDSTQYRIYKPNDYSDWVCYLFGATAVNGIQYRPQKGHEPNRFVRWMMKICFDCTWVKDK